MVVALDNSSASTKESSIAMQPPSPMCGGPACAASPMRTTLPSVDFDPFGRPKMELLVVFYGAEIGRDRRGKRGEALAKPFKASLKRVFGPVYVEGAEAVGVTLAHRHEAEKAPFAHQHHDVVDDPRRARRDDASPYQLPGIAG